MAESENPFHTYFVTSEMLIFIKKKQKKKTQSWNPSKIKTFSTLGTLESKF